MPACFVPCPRCGSTDHEVVVRGRDHLYRIMGEFYAVRCRQCGLMYQNPRPAKDEIATIYPSSYGPYGGPVEHAVSPPREEPVARAPFIRGWLRDRPAWNRWRDFLDLVPEFAPGAALLEIGCADGRRLRDLREKGWEEVRGIEMDPAAAERARSRGFRVECGAVEDLLPDFPDGSFDVVVASMVLEHLFNPFETVSVIAAKLRPGGEFLFSTIAVDSLDARIYGPYFGGFDFPRHMVYFRKRDILDMLRGQFTDIRSRHQNAPIDFLRSSTWRKEEGGGKRLDDFVIRFATTPVGEMAGIVLAVLGLTCRVSVRCRRKR